MKFKGKIIPVLRIDTATPKSNVVLLKEEITFDSVPRVVIFKDQRFYSFDQPFDRLDLFIHHINRLLNPLVVLNTEDEIEAFLGFTESKLSYWEGDYNTIFMRQLGDRIPRIEKHWDSQELQTRVVGFIFDKFEYREELNSLRNDARFLSTRDNLRIGVVENQKLVRKMKVGKYGSRIFPPVSMSSLVVRRYDGELKVHDITGDDHISFHYFINKNSVKEVEELNNESYRVMELIRQPMFLCFVDFEDPRYSKASYAAVESLKEVAPKYSHIIGFFHVNNTNMWQRKRVLGVTWDELPAMAFNMMGDSSSKVLPYPRGKEITKLALFDFFDDLLTGRKAQGRAPEEEYRPPADFSKVRNDTEIEPFLLNNTIIATRENFASLTYQEGYDCLVLLYTTEIIHQGQRNVALQVNLVGDAFIKLRQSLPNFAPSVRVIAYDVNVNAFPEGIEFTMDIPQILFFPAYNKRPPYRRFTGQAAIAGPILEFIQKYADVKFQYPVDVSGVGLPKNESPVIVNEEL